MQTGSVVRAPGTQGIRMPGKQLTDFLTQHEYFFHLMYETYLQ
jgi:hypothetical protein